MLRQLFLSVLCVSALLGLCPGEAQAQTFDVQQLAPASSMRLGFWGTEGARSLAHLQGEFGAFVHYADDPLVLRGPDGERIARVVGHQLTADLTVAMGLADRITLGIGIPVILSQSGEVVPGFPNAGATGAGAGIGDVRALLRARLLGPASRTEPGFGLGIGFDVRMPTGDEDSYQGGSVRGSGNIAAEYTTDSLVRVALNLGAAFRPESQLNNLDVNDALTWGIAAEIPVAMADQLAFVPELRGQISINAETAGGEETPVELLLGGKLQHESGVVAGAGFGTGLVRGYGTPDWRLFFTIGYATTGGDDPDRDGLGGDFDACPRQAEDFDGYEDDDGCPDEDNDGDGVPDTRDGPRDAQGYGVCRDEVEDLDGFEDDDGCPEEDNDQDGIPDTRDGAVGTNGWGACMNDAEDADGFEDADGCPEEDNDGDGVPDADDGAPDATGFGACRNGAEDLDGFEDDDGCIDDDNDGDGFFDAEDGEPGPDGWGSCMNDSEDYDGFEDDDGCPEEGEGLVQLTCDRIVIRERVFFESGDHEIERRSHELLNQVSSVLVSARHIVLLRVEGHTDSRGSDETNLELSQRRAEEVRDYLLRRGVQADRLVAEGFGETQPIADNNDDDERALNRRVDFIILEPSNECIDE